MYNPVDRSTTNAMIAYRHEQLNRDIEKSVAPAKGTGTGRRFDHLVRARTALGFSLIRLGSWLAGNGVRPRMDLQL